MAATKSYKICPITKEKYTHPMMITCCKHIINKFALGTTNHCPVCKVAYTDSNLIDDYLTILLMKLGIVPDTAGMSQGKQTILAGNKIYANSVIGTLNEIKAQIISKIARDITTGNYKNNTAYYITPVGTLTFSDNLDVHRWINILVEFLQDDGFLVEPKLIQYDGDEFKTNDHLFLTIHVI